MATQTYIPAEVAVSIGGNVIGGYADGTFISVERETDAYTKHVGADGEVSRTANANRSGTLTLTLKQTASSNLVLGAYANQDEASHDAVFDVLISDNLGNKLFASEGWIKKVPNQEYGDEQANREWAIDLATVIQEWPSA